MDDGAAIQFLFAAQAETWRLTRRCSGLTHTAASTAELIR
jgi:hypothetical protein